jgi:hypothetical protein
VIRSCWVSPMRQNLAALIALFPIVLAPALADVVDVTVDGTVTGSGTVTVRCDSCPGSAGFGGFSFSGSNAQVGAFSKFGEGSFTDISGRSATVSGLTTQVTAASATSVSVDFQVSAIVDGVGREWGAGADLSNLYKLGFTLTTASWTHLSAAWELGGGSNEGWFLDGAGVHLFSSVGSFDETFFADPGRYNLTIFDTKDFGAGPGEVRTHVESTDRLSLTADFTAVPEPRWTAVLLALFLILWQFVTPKTRTAARVGVYKDAFASRVSLRKVSRQTMSNGDVAETALGWFDTDCKCLKRCGGPGEVRTPDLFHGI